MVRVSRAHHMLCSCIASLLAQKPSGDVAHVCLLKLVIPATIAVDTNEEESLHNLVEFEPHAHKTIDQILVVAAVPAQVECCLSATPFILHYNASARDRSSLTFGDPPLPSELRRESF